MYDQHDADGTASFLRARYKLGVAQKTAETNPPRITRNPKDDVALNSLSFLLTRPIRVAPGIEESGVLHFTLRYLYL